MQDRKNNNNNNNNKTCVFTREYEELSQGVDSYVFASFIKNAKTWKYSAKL